MKHLLLLISLVCSIDCFSQDPNPQLFQTWYLYDIYSSDDNIHHPVSAVTPPISPYITFTNTPTLSHNGQGACNMFNGNFQRWI